MLILLATGCSASTACQQSISQSSLPLLQYQKAPCYGACPAYEATIMEDGNITLVAWKNMVIPDDDTIQLCLNKQELQALKVDIENLNYTSLQDAYLSEWTDVPSSYFTFYHEGKITKQVKHQRGGPQHLVGFEEKLHQKLMALLDKQVKKE